MSYVIRNATLVDALRNPVKTGDLSIEGSRIRSMGEHVVTNGHHTEIDGTGLTVMPGFVDMHSHSDIALIRDPSAQSKVLQGVTLEVLGQDGLSYAPSSPQVLKHLDEQLRGWNGPVGDLEWPFNSVGSYLESFHRYATVNVAYLVPHGTLRLMAMNDPTSSPTRNELTEMRRLLDEALLQGAVGMSAGLMYYPGMFSNDAELIDLGTVLQDHGGIFSPHHRNYGALALSSYEEMLMVGLASGCAVHLTHANLSFPVNEDRAADFIRLLDQYEHQGVRISLDTYPYDAGSTSLHALLPSWMHVGGAQALLERLGSKEALERVRIEMEIEGSDGFHGIPMDWSRLVISGTGASEDNRYAGMSIADAADADGTSAIDFVAKLLIRSQLDVNIVAHIGNESNVRRIMQDERHAFGTDGLLRGERPHPRAWGTYPRVLGRYVRELQLLTLPMAAWKMSRLPCQLLGVHDRGYLAEEAKADLVMLDADRVQDTATYGNPRQEPVGIHYVFVSGEPVVWQGRITTHRPGESIRRSSRA